MEYTIEKFASGMHYILLNAKTAASLTRHNNKRVICTLNKQVQFHCAIMPKKEGGSYINIGKAICTKLKLKVGSIVTATFKEDKTEYQFEMPEELKEVLATDDKANKIFHTLTPGNQRGLIYIVTMVKSSNKRIERALTIAEKIKNGVTSPKLMLS